MSDLPKGWTRVDFDGAVDVISDRGFRIKQKDYLPSGKLPVVDQGEGLIGGYTDDLDAQVTSPVPVIVFGDHTRRFKFVKFSFAVGADGVKLFSPTPIWNPEFLFLQLGTIDLENRGYGRHYQHLRKESLVLAPVAEQTRIVEKLEELLTDLDAGVAELKAAQKKLAQYRQSLLKAVVEGALTAEWRKQHTPAETGAQLLARILTERRARWEAKQLAKFKEQGKTPPKDWQKKYPEPVQPDTTDLPGLPEGWGWASVDQVAEVFLGKMLDKTKHTSGKKMPYLRNVNVRWGSIETHDLSEMFFDSDEHERYGLVAGDVLVCEGGEPGRAAVCKKEHEVLKYQKALHRVRLFGLYEPELLVAFLEHVAKTGRLDKTFTGSTINHFTKESFLTLHIPVAPLAEQKVIVAGLSEAMMNISEQNSSIEFSLKQSAAQRQNILRAAFAGQLVSQDPNEEPASVLLARIRAERAEREKQPKIRKTKQQKEIAAVVSKLIDVLAEAGDWVPAQEAFHRCGVADGAETEQVEVLYAELRALDKAGRLAVEAVTDTQGRKLHDRLKLLAN